MENRMRAAIRLLSLCVVVGGPLQARADAATDVKDDARKDSHAVKEKATKATHRVEEAGCTGTKAECASRKAKHRAKETKQKIDDKVDEATH